MTHNIAHTHNFILAIGSNLLPVVRAEGSSFLSSFCHNHSQGALIGNNKVDRKESHYDFNSEVTNPDKNSPQEKTYGVATENNRNSANDNPVWRNNPVDTIILTEQRTEPSLLRSVKAEGFSINTTSIDGFPSATIFASVPFAIGT
jgi:hypothetical protein